MINKLLEIINGILENTNRETIQELNEEMSLRKDLDFDSLDLAVLTVNIESEFDIDIFEEGNIDTIDEIIKRLQK